MRAGRIRAHWCGRRGARGRPPMTLHCCSCSACILQAPQQLWRAPVGAKRESGALPAAVISSACAPACVSRSSTRPALALHACTAPAGLDVYLVSCRRHASAPGTASSCSAAPLRRRSGCSPCAPAHACPSHASVHPQPLRPEPAASSGCSFIVRCLHVSGAEAGGRRPRPATAGGRARCAPEVREQKRAVWESKSNVRF